MKKYYIAYGSNLHLEQMKMRCPDSKLIGTGLLNDYKLLFRSNNRHNAVATVEPCVGEKVPIGIFEISERDEKHLDIYEGFPNLYKKIYMEIKSLTINDTAMLYVMNNGFNYGIPNHYYYSIIKKGYEDCHLDQQYLDHAVNSMKEIVKEIEQKETYPLGYKDIRQ
ncbi:gamma-glutamylcyclotransferase family protein [Thomasclavelia cocleata]|jgi:hypothetical protein|uniref:gamma-glutamylcyclotransferase family protein n=1 Tax=Thomasclavelia cocleata TaxID=69824 RepID=UPI00241D7370|nr:gamma-glutamylcyclotransferase family protein [Thomasclavelia cocleata]